MTPARRRGFTLAELLVGLAVTSIIMVAVAAAFVAVQTAYQAEAEVKTTVENGRTSLLYLERVVRQAGYGLDPRQAFDFGNVPGLATGLTVKDNQAVTGLTGVVTDDLAFRYRDPAFLRRGKLVSGTVTLEGGTWESELPLGKALIVACPGALEYAVVRTTALAAGTATTANTAAYGAGIVNSTHPCLSGTGANAPMVMMMHELRVRIVNIGGRPWLVAFRNLGADVTNLATSVYDPLAADVESFQVSYVMNRPPSTGGCCSGQAAPDPGSQAGNGNWVLGDASNETTASAFPDPAANFPRLDTAYNDATRYTKHPANIRQVRLSLALRSSRLESKRKAFAQRNLENGTGAATVPDGYYRTFMTTAVRVPNLAARSFFVPSLRASSDTTDLNAWGG